MHRLPSATPTALAPPTVAPPSFVATFNREFVPTIKANTPEAARLFVSLSHARQGFAKRFLADPQGNVGTLRQLVAEVAKQYRPRDGAKGKGKGKGKGASASAMPFANRNSKGAGKGNGPFAEQQVPECFCLPNEDPVLRAEALAVEGGEEGVSLVSNNEAMRIALDQIHRMPFAAPCALLASAAQYDDLFKNYPRIAERYRVERIVVPLLTSSKGGPRTTAAILF